MLKSNGLERGELRLHGFLVAVETEPNVSPEEIANKLEGSLTWVEGCGRADVNYLGEIEMIEEDAKEMN